MQKEKKIWIISELYYPTLNSTGYYMTEIAEYLALKGHNVEVITTNLAYNEGSISYVRKEVNKNVSIHRVILKQIDKNNFISRLFRLLNSSSKLFYKSLKLISKGDEVLVVTNPAFMILLMPLIKKLKHINYRILVHDIFPENLAAIKKINSKSFTYKLLKNIFDKSYSQAINCISIGRDMSEVIKSKVGDRCEIKLIPNWSETDIVIPRNKNETKLLNELNITNKFIFQFAGNLGHAQGLDNILEAIDLVKNPNIHFLFIGSGAKENIIKEKAVASKLKNITHVDFMERSQQNNFLNACDVSIVTLNDRMFGLGVPSKCYNIMAVNKPILLVAEENSEVGLYIKEFNIGWIVEPNKPIMLAETFEHLFDMWTKNGDLGVSNSRIIAENYFSKKITLEKYNDLFE